MITVILAEAEHPGNIGSVCRVMANFGCTDLILINPQCAINQESKNFAKHAQAILNNARIADWSVLKEFSVVAATAGKNTTDFNLLRTPLTPREASEKLKNAKGAALLFGRESDGLTNAELEKADFVITIQTSAKYPSMNLSHSVAVVLYELFTTKVGKRFTPATKELEILEQKFNAMIDELDFPTPTKRATQKRVWRNILHRALLTKRESFAALGLFSARARQNTQRQKAATRQTK